MFTYRSSKTDPARRWNDIGILNNFFDTLIEAKNTVLEIRAEVKSTSFDDWAPVYIERVELAPIVGRHFVTLLNIGIGPFVRACEVVETID